MNRPVLPASLPRCHGCGRQMSSVVYQLTDYCPDCLVRRDEQEKAKKQKRELN